MNIWRALLDSPYSLFVPIILVVVFIGLAQKKRLPPLDRFGLTKDEQMWLSMYQAKHSRRMDALNLIIVILLSIYFVKEKLYGYFGLTLGFSASFLIQLQRGKGVLRKVFDYIDKLEQKK